MEYILPIYIQNALKSAPELLGMCLNLMLVWSPFLSHSALLANSPSSSCNVRGEGEGRGGGGIQVPVGEPGPGEEPEVDQQRPRILAEEHSRPSDLKSSVLGIYILDEFELDTIVVP